MVPVTSVPMKHDWKVWPPVPEASMPYLPNHWMTNPRTVIPLALNVRPLAVARDFAVGACIGLPFGDDLPHAVARA